MILLISSLSLFLDGELTEYRIQDSMSDCLKSKRIATRNMDMTDKQLMCGQVKAVIDKNVDGSETIRKIIIESK